MKLRQVIQVARTIQQDLKQSNIQFNIVPRIGQQQDYIFVKLKKWYPLGKYCEILDNITKFAQYTIEDNIVVENNDVSKDMSFKGLVVLTNGTPTKTILKKLQEYAKKYNLPHNWYIDNNEIIKQWKQNKK